MTCLLKSVQFAPHNSATNGVSTRLATDESVYEPRWFSSPQISSPKLYNRSTFDIKRTENMKSFKKEISLIFLIVMI